MAAQRRSAQPLGLGLGLGLALVAAAGLAGLSLGSQGCSSSSSSGGGAPAAGAGADAQAYVSSQTYTRLIVEIDYVQGHAPDSAALALLEQRILERLAKPGGVSLQVDDAIAAIGTASSAADLAALEAAHRETFSGGDTAALYLLYVDGHSASDDSAGSVLGLAYSSSSLALYPETIASAANRVVNATEVESAVLVHELGHALGLVNLGTPQQTPHEDSAHPGHDLKEGCVMNHAIESTNVRLVIQNSGSVPTQFCAECIADLQAAGGK